MFQKIMLTLTVSPLSVPRVQTRRREQQSGTLSRRDLQKIVAEIIG